jgi:hypothetical protein
MFIVRVNTKLTAEHFVILLFSRARVPGAPPLKLLLEG